MKKKSWKTFLLPRSDSSSSSLDPGSFRRNSLVKTLAVHSSKGSRRSRVVKIRETTPSYEEFLEILQKPSVFVITWDGGTECCPHPPQNQTHFSITSISGATLLKGTCSDESVRVVDERGKVFMVLEYGMSDNAKNSQDFKATLTMPNTNIPLATLTTLPSYLPYNKRFRMLSEHFPELNYNVEFTSMPGRFGSLGKFTITSCNKILSKLLQPSTESHLYVLMDESVSVFQKTGILATAIYVSYRPRNSQTRLMTISIVFVFLFLLGFVVVGWKLLDLRFKDNVPKFPHRLKSADEGG